MAARTRTIEKRTTGLRVSGPKREPPSEGKAHHIGLPRTGPPAVRDAAGIHMCGHWLDWASLSGIGREPGYDGGWPAPRQARTGGNQTRLGWEFALMQIICKKVRAEMGSKGKLTLAMAVERSRIGDGSSWN